LEPEPIIATLSFEEMNPEVSPWLISRKWIDTVSWTKRIIGKQIIEKSIVENRDTVPKKMGCVVPI